ncbi:MAG TPA: polysaccharide biosynthesis/export family protein [Chitinophagaceae bacterium]|jgi:polysaccharide export outer membrane protein|nr:polysaccharide biosynthesis/export family protein [Chitinophagaceae bacterium]
MYLNAKTQSSKGKFKLYVLFILFFSASCVNTRKAVYFNDIKDSTIPLTISSLEPVIQKNDLLSISVSSLNTAATQVFNTPNLTAIQSSTATGGSMQASGYLVNQDGFIKFPILGNIKAAGLTKKALTDNITKSLIDSKQLLDPIVNIRYLNFRVTVLGEVATPTVVNVPSEKITLLEALGLAGDLTIYARRDNVMVLREEEGNRIIKRLDLNSNEILTSPYFYLKSNDIVYAEPNKSKVSSTSRAFQLFPVIISGLSIAIIVVDRVIR